MERPIPLFHTLAPSATRFAHLDKVFAGLDHTARLVSLPDDLEDFIRQPPAPIARSRRGPILLSHAGTSRRSIDGSDFEWHMVLALPPAGQSPYTWRDKLHRVARRIAEVHRPAPGGPINFLFDSDAFCRQELPPRIESSSFNSQRKMARPGGAMRRQYVSPERGLRQERQQDAAVSNLKENVTARLFADDAQTKDLPIKFLGSIEIIDVNGRLDDCLNVHGVPCTLAAA